MILASGPTTEKFGDIFPHIENVLQCGFYSYHTKIDQTYWSEGVYRILGVEPFSVECSVENLIAFVLPEYKEKVVEAIKSARTDQKPYSIEFSIKDGRGRIKHLHAEN